MALLPLLPIAPGESLISFVERLARTHARMGAAAFLAFIDLSAEALRLTGKATLSRLAETSGVPEDRLAAAAFLPLGDGMVRHRDEVFHQSLLRFDRISSCPLCLREGARDGHVVLPATWLLGPVRSCAKHGLFMVRGQIEPAAQRHLELAALLPADATLHPVPDAHSHVPSPLQLYVENRLDGLPGPDWLDRLPLDHAVTSAEMLGACLEFGTRVRPKLLTEAQWDRSGATGFAAIAGGDTSIWQALDDISRQSRGSATRASLRAAYGTLLTWLEKPGPRPAPEALRTLLRRHILETMAVEPGTKLLGETVLKRHKHDLYSAARATGTGSILLRRALSRAADRDQSDRRVHLNNMAFDPDEIETLARELASAIPGAQLAGHLNCNLQAVHFLIKAGHFVPAGPASDQEIGVQTGTPHGFTRASVDSFLRDLSRGALRVDSRNPGMTTMMAAAKEVAWPIEGIIRMVLSRRLRRIEQIAERADFSTLLVDCAEIRSLLLSPQGAPLLEPTEAASRLGVDRPYVDRLLRKPDVHGGPFIKHGMARRRGAATWMVDAEDLERFRRDHVRIDTLALELGQSPGELQRHLDHKGIRPILNRWRPRYLYYRRSEL